MKIARILMLATAAAEASTADLIHEQNMVKYPWGISPYTEVSRSEDTSSNNFEWPMSPYLIPSCTSASASTSNNGDYSFDLEYEQITGLELDGSQIPTSTSNSTSCRGDIHKPLSKEKRHHAKVGDNRGTRHKRKRNKHNVLKHDALLKYGLKINDCYVDCYGEDTDVLITRLRNKSEGEPGDLTENKCGNSGSKSGNTHKRCRTEEEDTDNCSTAHNTYGEKEKNKDKIVDEDPIDLDDLTFLDGDEQEGDGNSKKTEQAAGIGEESFLRDTCSSEKAPTKKKRNLKKQEKKKPKQGSDIKDQTELRNDTSSVKQKQRKPRKRAYKHLTLQSIASGKTIINPTRALYYLVAKPNATLNDLVQERISLVDMTEVFELICVQPRQKVHLHLSQLGDRGAILKKILNNIVKVCINFHASQKYKSGYKADWRRVFILQTAEIKDMANNCIELYTTKDKGKIVALLVERQIKAIYCKLAKLISSLNQLYHERDCVAGEQHISFLPSLLSMESRCDDLPDFYGKQESIKTTMDELSTWAKAMDENIKHLELLFEKAETPMASGHEALQELKGILDSACGQASKLEQLYEEIKKSKTGLTRAKVIQDYLTT
ncbi:MAG: hypothetical protein LBF56_03295 [Holosporales bacterium]|jgi:hypothetical protein|nr:hypothetical protein [Holosporales bacterium]